MYADSIDKFAKVGAHKASAIVRSPLAFLIGAAMAGAYIGFGDILMFSVGAHVDPAYVHLIMCAVFACALTIVVFAGSDPAWRTCLYSHSHSSASTRPTLRSPAPSIMRFSSRWAILSVAQSSWALVIGCRKAVFVIRRPQSCRRRPRAFAQTNLISSIHPLS